MRYKGGKNAEGVAQWIINQLPPHERYVEAFAGSAAVLRMKKPARASIAIDVDATCLASSASLFEGMQACTVICDDALRYLLKQRYGPETLVYLDPPYLQETRRSARAIYRHEFNTVEQHTELLEVLLGLDCMVALSGYWSSLYDAMLQGWRRSEKVVTLRQGMKATECLWMNYPEPVALHDYRFLGGDFRERERLKRISHRWKERLLRMPLLERRMLSAAIAEIGEAGQQGGGR
jgi:DNA adenine methylase